MQCLSLDLSKKFSRRKTSQIRAFSSTGTKIIMLWVQSTIFIKTSDSEFNDNARCKLPTSSLCTWKNYIQSVVPYFFIPQIRDECLAKGELWTDPEFGPNDIALWEGAPKIQGIEWKRPRVCTHLALTIFLTYDLTWAEFILIQVLIWVELLLIWSCFYFSLDYVWYLLSVACLRALYTNCRYQWLFQWSIVVKQVVDALDTIFAEMSKELKITNPHHIRRFTLYKRNLTEEKLIWWLETVCFDLIDWKPHGGGW